MNFVQALKFAVYVNIECSEYSAKSLLDYKRITIFYRRDSNKSSSSIREMCGCIKIVIIKNHAQQQDSSILEQLLESQFLFKQMPKTDKQSGEPQSHKMKHTINYSGNCEKK
ncbi:hypothetical protein pb186bvf_020842 [Paramecium bursaria]